MIRFLSVAERCRAGTAGSVRPGVSYPGARRYSLRGTPAPRTGGSLRDAGSGTRCRNLSKRKWFFQDKGFNVEVYRKVSDIVSGTGTRRRDLPQRKWRCFKLKWKQRSFALCERTTEGIRLSEYLHVMHSNKFSHFFAPCVSPFILSRNRSSATLKTTITSFEVYLYNCAHFMQMNFLLSIRNVRISLLLNPSGRMPPTWYRRAVLNCPTNIHLRPEFVMAVTIKAMCYET